MKSLIHYLFFQYWNYKKLSLSIMLTMVVTLIYTSAFSLSIKYIIDEIILKNQHFDKLSAILIVLLLGFIIHISCVILRDFWIAKISTAMQIDSRLLLFNHIQRLPADFYARVSRGSLTSRFTGDLSAVHAAFMTFIPAFYSIMSLILYLVLIATLHWSLAVLSIIGMIFSLSIPQLMSRKAIEASDTVKLKQTELMDIIQEHFSVQSVVRAYGLSHWQLTRLTNASEEQKPLTIRAHFLSRLMPSSVSSVLLLWNLLSIFIGAYLCLTNSISIGILIAFQSFFISTSQQLRLLSGHLPQLLSASLSYNRINNLLSEKFGEAELPSQAVLSVNQLNQEIRLSQVSFSYSTEVKNVIDKLDIRVPAYNYTAIVGMNGSGKSTIISLLMRFYEPSGGQVEMDGMDTRRISAADIREMTGYVSQENILFNLSIKENILLGKPSASQEEIDAAARNAGIYDWILGLPDGYQTKCGENGKALSGGQRQRVAIARALIRKPSILVLDEAASALDPESEDIIYQSIRALIGTRTIINVTHRLSSVTDADQIILMDNGKVRDSGSHEQLLSRCGMYQSMWKKQNGFVFSRDSRSVKVEVDRLRDIKLFQDLDLDLLEYLSDSLVTEFVYMGETVVEHGEEGNKFYIIVRGRVEVLKFIKGEQEMKQAAILADGDHFGEISLMLPLPRTATIRTLTPCTFLTIQRDQFQTMLDKASPQLREKLENDCQIRLVY